MNDEHVELTYLARFNLMYTAIDIEFVSSYHWSIDTKVWLEVQRAQEWKKRKNKLLIYTSSCYIDIGDMVCIKPNMFDRPLQENNTSFPCETTFCSYEFKQQLLLILVDNLQMF